MKFETQLIHAGEKPDPQTGAIAPVLVRSKTFAQQEFGKESEFQYSRGKNPTRAKLEEKLAALDGGQYAAVFGSGLAAEAAFFLTLSPDDHVLFCQEIYGGTYRLLDDLLSRFGITFSFADFNSEEEVKRAVTPKTKYLFVETPTNPSLHLIDLEAVGMVSRETGVPFVVDSTFAPPCTTRPLEYGAKAVIHSLSKYIAGHNDVLGGAVITDDRELYEQLVFMHKTLGAVLSPDECYRVLQGVKTLSLRYGRVSESALSVARFLSVHPKVKTVHYPGLSKNPAARQMKGGFGGVVSFELAFGMFDRFVKMLQQSGCVVYGESLASPETIIAYPPLMSHKSLPKDVRQSLGINDGFFRLSLGFEDPEDIILALTNALDVL